MKYDAVVIGSGQAGNPLAHKMADRGLRVALVEKDHLGGSCINYGCTPTKTMVASAQVAHYARSAERWGVRTGKVRVDLDAVVARKTKMVESFRSGQQRQVDKRETLDLHRGEARFVGPRQIAVGDEVLEGERIFINTGTRPAIPRIEGLDKLDYLTNVSIMELTELPKHLLVLGGGYIGMEFGQMFRRFGSRVTVIHRSEQVLSREDPDVATELQKALEEEGIEFRLNAEATRAEKKKSGAISLTVKTPKGRSKISGSHLLVATGRTPNTDMLELDKAGVETDKRGYVKANERLETTAEGVWALGDVKGGPAFTHISYNDHQIVYANLFEGQTLTTEDRYVPYAVFTDPQLGGVGMTEKQARASGHRLKIGKIPMSHVARALERDETAGVMKIIVNAEDDRILGASILGTEGGELAQMLGLVMRAGLPYTFLKGAVYTHPTLAEGFLALMASVEPAD